MTVKTTFTAAALIMAAVPAFAQDNPMVGGAEMLPTQNIVENAVNSADHTTLVAAVQAAELVDTLQSAGPFTVFAPTNAAFELIEPDALAALLEPENQAQLQQILTCHVLPTNALSGVIAGMAEEAGGTFEVETVGGCMLNVTVDGGAVTIEDERGRVANVTIADVVQSNGVIHVIDRVILPAS